MTKEGSGVKGAAAARPVLGGHTLLYSPIECLRLGVCASLVWQTSQLKVAFIFVARARARRRGAAPAPARERPPTAIFVFSI